MAKATLEFDLPADREIFEGAVFGADAVATLLAFEAWLQAQVRPEAQRLEPDRKVFQECLSTLVRFQERHGNAESRRETDS